MELEFYDPNGFISGFCAQCLVRKQFYVCEWIPTVNAHSVFSVLSCNALQNHKGEMYTFKNVFK